MSERILCAAIWVDDGKEYIHQPTETGLVFSGHRHHQIIERIFAVWPDISWRRMKVEGFLTSENRFVNRSKAYVIAIREGQIRGVPTMFNRLDSSDLY